MILVRFGTAHLQRMLYFPPYFAMKSKEYSTRWYKCCLLFGYFKLLKLNSAIKSLSSNDTCSATISLSKSDNWNWYRFSRIGCHWNNQITTSYYNITVTQADQQWIWWNAERLGSKNMIEHLTTATIRVRVQLYKSQSTRSFVIRSYQLFFHISHRPLAWHFCFQIW